MNSLEKCKICGLSKTICTCNGLNNHEIRIRIEGSKHGKSLTIVSGIQANDGVLKDIASDCKRLCACGGTTKNGEIKLQGRHMEKVITILVNRHGFSPAQITPI